MEQADRAGQSIIYITWWRREEAGRTRAMGRERECTSQWIERSEHEKEARFKDGKQERRGGFNNNATVRTERESGERGWR